jgi:hypothetical protein
MLTKISFPYIFHINRIDDQNRKIRFWLAILDRNVHKSLWMPLEMAENQPRGWILNLKTLWLQS